MPSVDAAGAVLLYIESGELTTVIMKSVRRDTTFRLVPRWWSLTIHASSTVNFWVV